MSLDATLLQYLEEEEWRVLTSVEIGQRNHEYVATELIHNIAGLRGTVHHFLGNLTRNRLLSHVGKPYDGYQLTKLGYDFLALHALVKRGVVNTLGNVIGQGKEADVYSAYDSEDNPVVIKFHRIGRVSFRKAKESRDYLSNKHTSSWLYLSRLSAQREFANLKALQNFPVPKAIDQSRHCVVMSLIPGTLLNNVTELADPLKTFNDIIDLAIKFLKIGVVHADFSEFNLIISEDNSITVIDFPQCMKHTDPEAENKFNHDINELRRFFSLRFELKVESVPKFSDFIEDIIPINLKWTRKEKLEAEEDENDKEEEDNIEKIVIQKVSKENRLKKKPVKRKESKTISKLKIEAKSFM